MMQDAVIKFPEQFHYKPKIENKNKLKRYKKFIVLGMGGSHLAADVLKTYNPSLPLIIHSDYGLPALDKKSLKETLIIASSYSGNTEEVIDGLEKARALKLPLFIIAVGGKLIELAKKYTIPYIQLPNTGIQPRSALGFSLLALLACVGDKKGMKEVTSLAKQLGGKNMESYREQAKALAKKLQNTIPVVYTSQMNSAIAYNWKIKLNETGKIPAFYNVFPELNHNEMTGFDVKESSKHLSEKIYFIFLSDKSDHSQNKKRMKVTAKLYQDRGLPVETIELKGKNILHKIFSSLLMADWTAIALADYYGLESEQVPMVEEFKKLVS